MKSEDEKSKRSVDGSIYEESNDVESQTDQVDQTKPEKDEYLVTLTEQEDPRQWTYKKRWLITIVVSLVTFISPATSSIVAPADQAIVKEFGITSTIISQMSISIFVLGYAVGPLVLSPLSEIYGRRPVIFLTNAIFFAFNLGCGFAQNTAQLIICRFFAGIGGSAPQSVGSGTLADLWAPEERGKAYAIYSLAPLLGPALGPIAGGFIAENTTWRWAFWATTIADAVIAVILAIWYRETYAPHLLRVKAKKLRAETGDDAYYSPHDNQGKSFGQIMRTNLVRPLRFLATQPIIQFVALYMAYLYGTFYLLLTTFPTLWTETYGESVGIGGLNYISVSVGCMLGAQIGARLMDVIYKRLQAKNDGNGMPEFRVPLMFISAGLFPVGMFIYGWTGYYGVHWIAPNIGMAVAAWGLVLGFTPLQIYVVDAYGQYAASAMAAVTLLRALCGFALPLAGPKMYESLGFGWGNSTLAFIALGVGIPFPLLMWFRGATIRRKSKWAVHT